MAADKETSTPDRRVAIGLAVAAVVVVGGVLMWVLALSSGFPDPPGRTDVLATLHANRARYERDIARLEARTTTKPGRNDPLRFRASAGDGSVLGWVVYDGRPASSYAIAYDPDGLIARAKSAPGDSMAAFTRSGAYDLRPDTCRALEGRWWDCRVS